MIEEKFESYFKELGINIKAFRKERKLSQKELGNLVEPKLDKSKISDMENGKEDFTFTTLLRLSIALNVRVEDITKGIG